MVIEKQTEFSKAERAEECLDAAEEPHNERETHAAAVEQDGGRRKEDASADHCADDKTHATQ